MILASVFQHVHHGNMCLYLSYASPGIQDQLKVAGAIQAVDGPEREWGMVKENILAVVNIAVVKLQARTHQWTP